MITSIENKDFSGIWSFAVDEDSILVKNEFLTAYLMGKREGIEESKQMLVDKLLENVSNSADITNKMLQHMNQKGITPLSAHLKINSFNDFVILITVSEDEFLSEIFLSNYEYATELEKEQEGDKYYNAMFMFSDREDDFDTSLLISEGFFLDYDLNKGNA